MIFARKHLLNPVCDKPIGTTTPATNTVAQDVVRHLPISVPSDDTRLCTAGSDTNVSQASVHIPISTPGT